jgi:PAS domain S-box-containing protein
MRNAWHCYLRWGATGKVRQLEELYPHLREEAPIPAPASRTGTSVEQLDLGTVVKASHAVAGEIVLEKLIETLMVIALEHAGAERGLLILPHGEEHRIAAEAKTGRDGVEVQLQDALVRPSDLPDSLLRYVIRTQESVILDDALVQNLFLQDEYVRRQLPRSILCLPLVKQAKLTGVLYLENKLAPRVFTPKRLAMLELLASQAAISLDHARLYAELTQENSDRRKAEEALRASEERWRKLFENSSAGIALVTPAGCYIAANLALQKMLGYTQEELQRLTVLEVSHEEDCLATEAILAESAEGQRRNYRIEKRYRRKDGNVIWADVSGTLVPATGSAPAFFAAVVVDITERKRAEEELRRSEAYLTQGERIGHTGSWGWHVGTGLLYWSKEHFRIFDYDPETTMPSYSLFLERIHPEDRFSFEEILNRAVRDKSNFEYDYRIVLPDTSTKFLRSVGQALVNSSGELEFIGTVMDITDLKRAEEMRAAMARERELFARRRATDLAKANEALRGCLDALASVPELDDFLGQVMAAITNQLCAVSSTLRLCNFEKNILSLELVFQDGRVMSPAEAGYPEAWQSWPLDNKHFSCFDQPATVQHIVEPEAMIPEDKRAHLLALGVKTVLVIPLISRGQANGRLTFRFTEERDFQPEELEVARALATQASLAIHLTRLAKTARQSAVLEERNQLATEIHDALAQSFTGISMQLGVAGEQLAAKEGDPIRQIQRANEIAKFGLAEARRSILSLRSNSIEESGLTTTLQRLVEHSNVAGQWRCDFRSDNIPEERLPPRIQHELLRFAQEAISNAVRHAKPTVVNVTLRWHPPNLILKVKDNGSGISRASLEKSEGFGLSNMRTRASQIDGKLDIQTAAGHGTNIVLTVPIPS